MFDRLQSTFDLIAAQAAGAHRHALRHTIDENTNLLRVRSPGAARLAVGMADIVAVNHALAADFTKLSHTLSHLLTRNSDFDDSQKCQNQFALWDKPEIRRTPALCSHYKHWNYSIV